MPPPTLGATKDQAGREAVEAVVGSWEPRQRGVMVDQKLMGRAGDRATRDAPSARPGVVDRNDDQSREPGHQSEWV